MADSTLIDSWLTDDADAELPGGEPLQDQQLPVQTGGSHAASASLSALHLHHQGQTGQRSRPALISEIGREIESEIGARYWPGVVLGEQGHEMKSEVGLPFLLFLTLFLISELCFWSLTPSPSLPPPPPPPRPSSLRATAGQNYCAQSQFWICDPTWPPSWIFLRTVHSKETCTMTNHICWFSLTTCLVCCLCHWSKFMVRWLSFPMSCL